MVPLAIGGIMRNDRLSLLGVLGVPDRPGVAGCIFETLGLAGINTQFVVQCIDQEGRDHVVFCVQRAELDRARQIVQESCSGLCAGHLVVRPEVAYLAIYGPDFRDRPGIAGVMFGALARAGVNILAISTSISTVSCIVDLDRADDADRVLRSTFVLPQ